MHSKPLPVRHGDLSRPRAHFWDARYAGTVVRSRHGRNCLVRARVKMARQLATIPVSMVSGTAYANYHDSHPALLRPVRLARGRHVADSPQYCLERGARPAPVLEVRGTRGRVLHPRRRPGRLRAVVSVPRCGRLAYRGITGNLLVRAPNARPLVPRSWGERRTFARNRTIPRGVDIMTLARSIANAQAAAEWLLSSC